LRSRYITPDGRYRVEVFLKGNLLNTDALERFVAAVTAVVPSAINVPVTIREAGGAVVRSFIQATIYATIAIMLFLLIGSKSVWVTFFTLLPLGLSLLLTVGTSAALDIPFNFANVIVVPLLLGYGVDTGIYFVYRFKTDPPASGNMLETSTARALFFSTLTTILGLGTLSFSTHRGIASMGKLLIICIGFLMISTLLVLPGLLGSKKSRGRNS
jgi:predicted RND superfamily exporter protein